MENSRLCPQHTTMTSCLLGCVFKKILGLGHNEIWQPLVTKVHLWVTEYDYILYKQSSIKAEGFSDISVVIKSHFIMNLLLKYIMVYSVQQFLFLDQLS